MNTGLSLFLIIVIWVLFIHPFFQAISLASVYIKALGKDRQTSRLKIHWWAQNTLFLGKNFTTIRTDYFEWSGIGDWEIYQD